MVTFAAYRITRVALAALIVLLSATMVGFWWTNSGRSARSFAPAVTRYSLITLAQEETPETRHAVVGEPAPDFTLSDLDGRAVSLSALKGRPVLLYFWATWCHYCTEALPELMALQAKEQESGLQVLAINILEGREKVAAYAAEHKLTLPVLLDQQAAVSQAYLIRATPTYLLIDRNGLLADVIIGTPRKGALEGRLADLLEVPYFEEKRS